MESATFDGMLALTAAGTLPVVKPTGLVIAVWADETLVKRANAARA
jgi:hypothetical protein